LLHRSRLALGSLSAAAFVCALTSPAIAQFRFSQNYVDTAYGGNGVGWVRAGDMDNDGDPDIVAGGGGAMFIYQNDGKARGWKRFGNLDGTKQMGANGAVLYDVDGDKDLDVVCAEYLGEFGWWENPGGPLKSVAWTYHKFHDGFRNWFLHDLIGVDLDGDGKVEFVANLQLKYWNAPVQLHVFQPGSNPKALWNHQTLQARRDGLNHCHAGFAVGDIDRDGHLDLAYSDGWYEAPNTITGTWKWHREITDVYGISNSRLADLNKDGRLDLIVSAGHHGQGVFWFAAPSDPVNGKWVKHAIDATVVHPEGLQVEDFDQDGDLDVIACDLFFDAWDEKQHDVYLYENLGGTPPKWKTHNVAPNSWPSHLLVLADMNQDGRPDLIADGGQATIVTYHENTTPPRKPSLTGVTSDKLQTVTNGYLDVTGANLDLVDEVTIGTHRIDSKDPDDWHVGYFEPVGPTALRVYPGQEQAPGSYDLVAWYQSQPSNALKVTRTTPAKPVLATHAGLTAGRPQWFFEHRAALSAAKMSLIALSPSLVPTKLTATISLGIGDSGKYLLVFSASYFDTNTGVARLGPVRTIPELRSIRLYFQAILFDQHDPLATTNIATTLYR